MNIRPILASLRHNRLGALLILLQIALTLAIVSNALSIIVQNVQRMQRPSGIDEAHIVVVNNVWFGEPDDLKARTQNDLAALRGLPGVVDAFATRSIPLGGSGWGTGLDLAPDQKDSTADVGVYFGDEHMLNTLGLRLTAGRGFTADDAGMPLDGSHDKFPPLIIITRALAHKLFPHDAAVGKVVYIDNRPETIVGVVERLQVPWGNEADAGEMAENSVLMPGFYAAHAALYVIRTQPGRNGAVLAAARNKLLQIDRMRLIGARQTRTFAEVRANAYRGDAALIEILAVVCALLLAVTGLGIVGLTSYWVSQRRRQIGVRRALGARRIDILRHFQTENLLIAGAGVVLGMVLALSLNLWLVRSFEMTRMGPAFVLAGAAVLLGLGQCAVLWPALAAARVPPVVAVRTL